MKAWLRALVILAVLVAVAVGAALLTGSGGVAVGALPLTAVVALAALGVNWLVFIPSNQAQTEKYYDLTGSITYLAVVLLLLGLSEPGLRGQLACLAVAVWAVRLGTFLYRRIAKDGRFDEIKTSTPRFLVAWSLQGMWVFLTSLAVTTLVAGGGGPDRLLGTDVIGGLLWVGGWALELVADGQKSRFRADPANAGKFIDVGVWRWSRHPNYLGEITLWTGLFLVAAGTFTQAGQWAAVLSPLFVSFLLTKVSGIPMLEKRADEKWGGDADYEAYKQRVPVLLPRIPRP